MCGSDPAASRRDAAWHQSKINNPKFLSVPRARLLESPDINLSGDRYRETAAVQRKWPMVKLGDERFFTIESGGTPSSIVPEYWGGDIRWVTLVDLPQGESFTEIKNTQRTISETGLKNSSAVLLPKRTVLVSSRATIGRIGIALEPMATNQGFKNIVIGDFDQVNERYVAYAVARLVPVMDQMASGGTFKEISKTSFSHLEIPLPPLSIQQQMVVELDGYRKVIEGARQVIANYKPTIKIDPKWPKVKLGEVAEVIAGQSPEGKYYNEIGNGTPFYQGKTEFGEMYIGEPKIWTTQIKKLAEPGDILMSVRAPVGPVNLTIQGICIGRGLAAIREKKIHQMFLFYNLKSMQDKIKGSGGAVFDSISKAQIEEIEIPLPPLESQRQIVAEIEAERALVEGNRELIARFEQKLQAKLAEIWGEE